MRCPYFGTDRLLACFTLGLILLAPPALANAWQDWEVLRRQAADYLRESVSELYPEASVSVEMGPVDERLRFTACPRPIFSLPGGGRAWGAGSLAVRCETPTAWTLYLSFQTRLRGPALVARTALPERATVSDADVELKNVDYQYDPGIYLRDLGPFRGAILARPLAAGTPLQVDLLRRPLVVRAGQRVRVLAVGQGFEIGQDGVAQGNAAVGEGVKVKLQNKRLVQGVAQADGTVRIAH